MVVDVAVFGAGAGKKNLSVMTLGTGIGGGVVTNGRIQRGMNGFAGEFLLLIGAFQRAWAESPNPDALLLVSAGMLVATGSDSATASIGDSGDCRRR